MLVCFISHSILRVNLHFEAFIFEISLVKSSDCCSKKLIKPFTYSNALEFVILELGTLDRIPLGRMDTWSKGPLGRMDTWSNGHLVERATWSKYTFLNLFISVWGHFVENYNY